MFTDGSPPSHPKTTNSPATTEEGGEVVNAIKLLVVLDWAETATTARAPMRRDLMKYITGSCARSAMLMIQGETECDWNE